MCGVSGRCAGWRREAGLGGETASDRARHTAIQDRHHGWMIYGLIKYIVEQIIPHISPRFYRVILDIVEVTSAVSSRDIREALELHLMMEKLQLAEECEELSCVICMEEGRAAFALMPCKHVFHVRAIPQLIATSMTSFAAL